MDEVKTEELINSKLERPSEEDVKKIAELNRLFHQDYENFVWDSEEWVLKEIRENHYYVLRFGKEIVGAICLQRIGEDELYIETIAVSKDLHGKGVGKRMIELAKEIAKSENRVRLTVETFVDYNLEGFYTKVGFVKDEPSIGYFKEKPYHRFVMGMD